MVINKIHIEKFRGFQNIEFDLGTLLTVIAGQNGTQKTTILGMLSQPFTISEQDNPMKDEKPLSGGSFKSAFSEKFKLSDTFDQPKEHEWSLHIKDVEEPFTIESIARQTGKTGVRFWKKGSREKGSGYIQLPVIFLSLKRLMPIGEDNKLKESEKLELTTQEKKDFIEWHKKILISQDGITNTNYLESPDKTTLGINTNDYDWKQNSAGQDNIGKILLAVLSFRRLQEKYPSEYKGGILAIDELDATLYPGSQIKLLEFLRKFSSEFNLQIIFTTHSLSILEKACEWQESLKDKGKAAAQIKVIFLEKKDNKVKVTPDISIDRIKNKLNVTIEGISNYRINAFTEDREAAIFSKAILKSKASKLNFIDCNLGCTNLIDLGVKKIPSFTFPNGFIFLDGDVEAAAIKKAKPLKNYISLPSKNSPERALANFLNGLAESDNLWESIDPDFTKQYCFKDYTIEDINADRDKAKKWFILHLSWWGKNATKVINPWINANKEEVEKFNKEFIERYNEFAVELGLKKLT